MEAYSSDAMQVSDGGLPSIGGVDAAFGGPVRAMLRPSYESGLSDRRNGTQDGHRAGVRIALRTVGAVSVEHAATDAAATGSLLLHSDNVLILVPLTGAVRVAGSREHVLIRPGSIGLITVPGRITLEWEPFAEACLIKLSRHLLQERMLADSGEPSRLRAAITVLHGEAGLSGCLRLVGDRRGVPAPGDEAVLEKTLIGALAGRLAAEGERLVTPATALKAALHHVARHPAKEHRLEDMAQAVGVSARLLRRELGDVLGITLSRFISNSRIDRARQLLESGRESRSIADLARALGFSSGSAFSRAYAVRFGVPPSQARGAATQRG